MGCVTAVDRVESTITLFLQHMNARVSFTCTPPSTLPSLFENLYTEVIDGPLIGNMFFHILSIFYLLTCSKASSLFVKSCLAINLILILPFSPLIMTLIIFSSHKIIK